MLKNRSSHCGSVVTNPTSSHEGKGEIPGLTQWLRIERCHALQCRSQSQLESCVAVAWLAGSCRSDSTPSLGTSTCCGYGPKKQKKKKENYRDLTIAYVCFTFLSKSKNYFQQVPFLPNGSPTPLLSTMR